MKVPRGYLGIKKPRVEMLPLIDIVFLLLVFFIYAMLSMAVHRSLPVSLPESSAAATDTAVSITVTVRKNGAIFLDEKNLFLHELGPILTAKAQMNQTEKGRKVQVTLFADKDIAYQDLFRILDVIRSAGIANVSLQADNK